LEGNAKEKVLFGGGGAEREDNEIVVEAGCDSCRILSRRFWMLLASSVTRWRSCYFFFSLQRRSGFDWPALLPVGCRVILLHLSAPPS